jgi:hypothetical protein
VTVVALAIEGVLIPKNSDGKIEADANISAVSKTPSEGE